MTKPQQVSQQASDILRLSPGQAWERLREQLWDIFSAALPQSGIDKEIIRRDRQLTEWDNLIAASAWDIWNACVDDSCAEALPRGSRGIIDFWNATNAGPNGKAVLFLDGLSLREVPLLLAEAKKRQFCLTRSGVWVAELPGRTTAYAKAIGFSGRSALANNQTESKHLPGAWTESCNLPFLDCAKMIPPKPLIVFWHHWPDMKMHESTLESLAKDAAEKLTSNDFWTFIERLTMGRTLLITSDHGYAATGFFHELQDKAQAETMQSIFKGQRDVKTSSHEQLPWIPPLDLTLGSHRYALGRRKWKIQGGYPHLQHGGLSLLEMFVPFIEIQR